MNRAAFLIAAAAATAAPKQPVLSEVTLQRDADALLSPFTVAIALRNTTTGSVRLNFSTADLFRIDVLRDDLPVWSSLYQHKPIPINHEIDLPPGLTKLASMTIDGETNDRRCYAPGKYTVRVAMLGTPFGMVVDKDISFAPPLSIADALQTKPGTVVTVAGEQTQIGLRFSFTDGTTSVRLSHSLGLHPTGTYVLRGFLDATGDDRVFDVGRFAPAFDNGPSPARQ